MGGELKKGILAGIMAITLSVVGMERIHRLAERLTAVYPAEGSRPEDGRPAATLLPLVNRLREVAQAARAAAPLTVLQAQVAELQAVVQETSPASDLSRALDALVPLTVEALQTELAYVQHLISLGLSRAGE